MALTLYSYFRSSTSYRVRIALNVKGADYNILPVNLLKGEQRSDDYRKVNPAGGLPTLVEDGQVFTQSLAILEYIEERWPTPALLPADAAGCARVRALSQVVGCDIHPLNNLKVLHYITGELAASEAQKLAWMHHWLAEGFRTFETMVAPLSGEFCYGDQLTLADICLIPQVFNAERFGHEMSAYPTIMRIVAHCRRLSAFERAHPANQPDAQ